MRLNREECEEGTESVYKNVDFEYERGDEVA